MLTTPRQRARSHAQMTGSGSGAAEFNPQHHSIRQREKSGLADTPVRMLVIFSPGHIEGLFKAVAARKSDDDIAALADKFGCLIVGPSLHEGIHSISFAPLLRGKHDDGLQIKETPHRILA